MGTPVSGYSPTVAAFQPPVVESAMAGWLEGKRAPLSFSIELEFILLSEDHQTTMQEVLRKLLEQPVLAECSLPGCQTKHGHSFTVSLEENNHYCWRAVTSETLMLIDEELGQISLDCEFNAHLCEVRSPAFFFDAKPQVQYPIYVDGQHLDHHNPWYSPELEIFLVLSLINRVNEPEKRDGNLRAFTNSSCGYHVHVGSGVTVSHGFRLQTVQNILGLATVFERHFDSIHDVNRIGGSLLVAADPTSYTPMHDRELPGSPQWCLPLSAHHAHRTYKCQEWNAIYFDTSEVSSKKIQKFPIRRFRQDKQNIPLRVSGSNQNVIAWQEIIHSAESINDLVDLFDGREQELPTVNICPLKGGRQTIEFRQHAGTLEAAEILAWVRVVICVVDWGRSVSREDYLKLTHGKWDDFDFSFVDLLEAIGASKETLTHYQTMRKWYSTSYADQCFLDVLQLEDAHPKDDPLRRMMKFVAKERQANRNPEAIQRRIDEKFKAGCYGKFPEKK